MDAAELSPGEFAHRVRRRVDEDSIKTVVIDSLNGYQAAMPEEDSLILHMHELLQYLNRQGATTFMTVAQHGLVGDMKAPVDVTYLADTVILLRYRGAWPRPPRGLDHQEAYRGGETTIREYRIDNHGLSVGAPLEGSRECCAAFPPMSANRPLLQARVHETGRIVRTGRRPGPGGRDASVAAARSGRPDSLPTSAAISPAWCTKRGRRRAGLIADEAVQTADLRGLPRWLNASRPGRICRSCC